jgi:hypothetical protein
MMTGGSITKPPIWAVLWPSVPCTIQCQQQQHVSKGDTVLSALHVLEVTQ